MRTIFSILQDTDKIRSNIGVKQEDTFSFFRFYYFNMSWSLKSSASFLRVFRKVDVKHNLIQSTFLHYYGRRLSASLKRWLIVRGGVPAVILDVDFNLGNGLDVTTF